MTPTVGRIIHVTSPDLPETCRAAIVAGIDYNPPTIHASVFHPTNPLAPVFVATVDPNDRSRWHDPRECPETSDPR